MSIDVFNLYKELIEANAKNFYYNFRNIINYITVYTDIIDCYSEKYMIQKNCVN
mgnify:CR=1 FL=1